MRWRGLLHPYLLIHLAFGEYGFGGDGERGDMEDDQCETPRPHWVAETDQFVSLAIGALAQSPQNPNVMYAGTGGFSSAFASPEQARGILKSVDGGNTWFSLGDSTDKLRGKPIRQISVSSGPGGGSEVVFAATFLSDGRQGGLFRSQDGGVNWTDLSGATRGRRQRGCRWVG